MDTREHYALGVCRNIIRTSALLRRDLDKILSAVGISGPQFGILSQLEKYGSMPLSELGKRLWVTGGNVTGLVDRLVSAGYVRRIRSDSDRRVILAELTDEGRELTLELRPRHQEYLVRFTSALSESELRELEALLEKINSPISDESEEMKESGGEQE
jgi:DNA-binding MarR family transcriptional regulator